MGRGMLKNIVKKTNAQIVSVYDVNSKNIDDFMNSINPEEAMKVRICSSPADVSQNTLNYYSRAAISRNYYHAYSNHQDLYYLE
jgi:seryl-tRNA(Sec) selenium transferase